jgi:CheY-like chemotaxis protein
MDDMTGDGDAPLAQGIHVTKRLGSNAVKTSGHRVLIVDDNEDVAASLAMLLAMQGVEVHVEHDGPSALRAVRTFAPTIALLDIGMPGMTGYEVAKTIRSDAEFAKVKLIALTGWGQPSDVRQAHEAGFDRHCIKPVDPELLVTLLSANANE